MSELENKPVSELTNKEMKQLAQEYNTEQKEQLKKDLENIKIIYVSYLNSSYTEMLFWYIDESKEYYQYPVLRKVWISQKTLYDSENMEVIHLKPFDKPHSWQKSRGKQYHYCFRAGGYGYSKKDHCLESLYNWLYGYGHDKDLPRIEDLN